MATSTLGSGTLVLAGTTSGTTTVTATAVAGTTTLTLPAATDTLVGKATTDTLTNKTLTSPTITGTLTTTGNTILGDASTDTLNVGNGDLVKDASGNLGVGTTAPQNRLQVVTTTRPQFSVSYNGTTGLYLEDATNSAWKSWKLSTSFGNGSDLSFVQSTNTSGTPTWAATAAMTLDASGNLLVGTTNSSGTTGEGFKVLGGRPVVVNAASTNGGGTVYEAYSTGAAAYRFYVGMGGTIYATSTTISAISDIRFKANVRDLDAGLSEVMALKPRLFDWKEGKGADIKNARGFIAQEFEEVFPDLIDEWKDPAPEGEEPYKSVRQDLIPVLVKAIQEQQALITTLTARITALESA